MIAGPNSLNGKDMEMFEAGALSSCRGLQFKQLGWGLVGERLGDSRCRITTQPSLAYLAYDMVSR